MDRTSPRTPTRHAAGLLLVPLLALLGACGPAQELEPVAVEGPLLASCYPVGYVAERLAAGVAEVRVPLPDGTDPARWRPTRLDLEAFQRAPLVVLNGADFEGWVRTASLPPSRVVDTSVGLSDRFLHYAGTTHSHGPAGAHTHEGVDGHTWMDPALLRLQAAALREALARTYPDAASTVHANAAALFADLEALEAELRALSEPLAGRALVTNHPAYAYLARNLGWTVRDLDLDPGQPLDGADLDALRAALEPGPAACVLWESEPLAQTARTIRETFGLPSVLFTPAELRAPEWRAQGLDYLDVQRANVARLRAALEEPR